MALHFLMVLLAVFWKSLVNVDIPSNDVAASLQHSGFGGTTSGQSRTCFKGAQDCTTLLRNVVTWTEREPKLNKDLHSSPL